MESEKYPNPPELNIIWYSSPEETYRKMWESAAHEEGISVDELLSGSGFMGIDENGNDVDIPMEDVYAGMRSLGCWGWVDTEKLIIHSWAEKNTDPMQIMHFLGHEIGHVTGAADEDDFEEEMRAEQYGHVAKLAYKLFSERVSNAWKVK